MPKLPEIFNHVFFDPHVHLREPSPINTSEDFESGTKAALAGGAIGVCDIGNTPGHPTATYGRVVEKHRLAYRNAYLPVGFWLLMLPDGGNIGELAKSAPDVVGPKVFGD